MAINNVLFICIIKDMEILFRTLPEIRKEKKPFIFPIAGNQDLLPKIIRKEVIEMWKKVLCVCLAIAMVTSPLLAQQTDADKARADARQDAKEDVNDYLWIGVGCCLGGGGVLLSHIIEPSPPPARLVGKSPEYIYVYTDTYKATAKREQLKNAIAGCVPLAFAYTVFLLVTYEPYERYPRR